MGTKTVLETLEAARKLIADPAKWTQREYARDSHGKGLMQACDPSAVCWCAQGAIRKAYGEESDLILAVGALKTATSQNYSFVGFNDTHTHAEVLAAFDAAIAKEKEAQHA